MAGQREKIETYRSRAEELRGLAEQMRNPESRDLLLNVANDYEKLAAALERQDLTRG